LHGLVSGTPENYGLVLSDRRSRGNSLKLSSELCKTNIRKYYFANRICAPWNALNDDIVLADNVKSFKRGLQNFNLDDFLS